jgi:hypothetical protein
VELIEQSQNCSTAVLEWGVVDKADRPDLTVIGKERVPLRSIPGCQFPIRLVIVCHLSVEAASKSENKNLMKIAMVFCSFSSNQTVTGKAGLEVCCDEVLRLEGK